MAKSNDTASVLAFEKKLVPSDGYLSSMIWGEPATATALSLQEKSVRGTISNRLKAALQNDPAKLNAEVEKPNLQTIDACALKPEHDTLRLQFTLKVLGGISKPSACNNALFGQSYKSAIDTYKAAHGFSELGKRYAMNIANARFLWRNRVGAEDISVTVRALNKGETANWNFDSLSYGLRNFDTADADVADLGTRIAQALASDDSFLMLEIDCQARIGKAQDVYPSEELVLDKGAGKKSKILYAVDGQAALHSQKLGNALRTVDTWYPAFTDPIDGVGPIAIEPYGAVTNLGKAFRTPKDKQDFYTFFDKWARGDESLNDDQQHFVAGILVRGGVFGESDKG